MLAMMQAALGNNGSNSGAASSFPLSNMEDDADPAKVTPVKPKTSFEQDQQHESLSDKQLLSNTEEELIELALKMENLKIRKMELEFKITVSEAKAAVENKAKAFEAEKKNGAFKF